MKKNPTQNATFTYISSFCETLKQFNLLLSVVEKEANILKAEKQIEFLKSLDRLSNLHRQMGEEFKTLMEIAKNL